MNEVRVTVITGLSGAGKSQAVKCFEDMGYFCVDNLPPALLPKFVELCNQSEGRVNQIALVIDIRGGRFFDDLFNALEQLNEVGVICEILFLEASNDVLIKRFKESRRNHPLSPKGNISAGIDLERKKLQELRGKAHKIIDTSKLKPGQLKDELGRHWNGNDYHTMNITVMSFGYKHGIPMDTDLLMDVRFIPNPYYIPELKELTGIDIPVQEYVYQSEESREFLHRYVDLLKFLVPHYIKEGKTHLTVAVGCTGGQHRSVALVEKVAQLLQQEHYHITIKHRDMPERHRG